MLYHFSEVGISGPITPNGNGDFGNGFYMGYNRYFLRNKFCHRGGFGYKIQINDYTDLKTYIVPKSIRWVLLTAYFRGKLESVSNSKYVKNLLDELKDVDIIIGNIKLKLVFDMFFGDIITDKQLMYCLSKVHCEKQIIAVTSKACEKIKIVKIKTIRRKKIKPIRITQELKYLDYACNNMRGGLFFKDILQKIGNDSFLENDYIIK